MDSSPDLHTCARRLSAQLGPLRRRVMQASRAAAGLPDIPDAQVEVLRRLDMVGWASPTTLGHALGLARSTVSNLCSTLERDGLVERRAHAGDARSVEVGLSERARQILRHYDASAEKVLVAALSTLPAQTQRDIAAALPALDALAAAIDAKTPHVAAVELY